MDNETTIDNTDEAPPRKTLHVEKEVLVDLIHTALATFPVVIYNGHELPSEKTLPEALTSISLDLRNVKIQAAASTELLSGIKERREAVNSFKFAIVKFGKYIGINTKWKMIFGFSQTAVAVYGLYQIIMKVFFPEAPHLPLPKK